MDNFIDALINLDLNEFTSFLDTINNHISNGYLTYHDKLFLDFLPIFKVNNLYLKKLINKEENNV